MSILSLHVQSAVLGMHTLLPASAVQDRSALHCICTVPYQSRAATAALAARSRLFGMRRRLQTNVPQQASPTLMCPPTSSTARSDSGGTRRSTSTTRSSATRSASAHRLPKTSAASAWP
ncbi:hypothetical protein BX600DRAFT_138689 [Xylariales sp. PMI_506]|nr:hypothetical protein BX600DRAFT_138689 [Xylariales sp. PMI_506]